MPKKVTTFQQSEDPGKKGDKTPVNEKDAATIAPGQRDNDSIDSTNTLEKLQTRFVVRMNGTDHKTTVYFHDSFYTDDSGNMEEMNDDTVIDTIYNTVIHESFNEMLTEYNQHERRTLLKLYNMGRNSNELYRALHFENKEKGRNIIIERKKTSEFDIVRSIYEFSHVFDNGCDIVVFDFDMLLVNMVNDDDVFYDKVDSIWCDHCNQDKSNEDSGSVDVKPTKKRTDQIEAARDDSDYRDADQGPTTNNRKVVYSKTDQAEDIVMDISNHDTTTGIRNVMSGQGLDSETREDRNRGRRQQSKEYVKDLSHIPFRSLDPALCKNRVSGDPMVADKQRFGTLEKLAEMKIPDERKRNHGTVSAYEAFDPICILGWYMNLESRCLRNGIYIPPLRSFMSRSYMGAEWESDFCPKELYDKGRQMDVGVIADLRYLCSKYPDLMQTLIASIYGYQTLKSIMVRYCAVLKDDGIADQKHLDFKCRDSIPRRAQKVREYILENKFLGTHFSRYQEFKLMIGNFPLKHKDFLDTKATLLLTSNANFDKDRNIPFELTIEQCATWIILTFEEGGVPIPSATTPVNRVVAAIDSQSAEIKNDSPSEAFVEKCIDAMRKRECWGCKSSDHTLDQCPTHCITSQANLLDKSKVVKREPFKRDTPFKRSGMKKVNAVTFDNVKPASSPDESSGEDLCTTFGHLTNEEPTEVLDVDDHMVRRIAMEMKDDYNACASHPYDTTLDFRYDDEPICSDAGVNAIDGFEFCYECGSHDHTHRECPHLEAVHFTDDSSEKGFECLQSPF